MEAPPAPLHAGAVGNLSSSPPQQQLNRNSGGGDRPPLLARQQEDIVKKFAMLLSTDDGPTSSASRAPASGTPLSSGSGSAAAALQAARSKGLASLLSKSVADDEVVLVLPSLDMRLSEESTNNVGGKKGANGAGGVPSGASAGPSSVGALPKLGETKDSTAPAQLMKSNSNPAMSPDNILIAGAPHPDSRPSMAASVLTAASNKAAKVEELAAIEMNKKTSWTRSTVVYASHAVATNASEFFSKLIDSRLRAWTLLLLRHSLSTGDAQSRTRLLSMLSASIQVKKAETRFKTLSLPESAKGQAKEADVILPLLFEVVLHLTIQDKPESVTLRAPGTISAFFDNNKAIKKVSTRIDTGVMLTAMVDHARIIVFKAVANATKTQVPASPLTTKGIISALGSIYPADAGDGRSTGGDEESSNPTPAAGGGGPESSNSRSGDQGSRFSFTAQPSQQVGNPSGLSRFRSALNLSSAPPSSDEPQSMLKARSSALRLNCVLQGKKGADASKTNNNPMSHTLGPRRVRSVKWDTPLQIPRVNTVLAPSPKKQRMAENAAKLKSFKSFGRPHAGDFGSGPRNATFGEYGGRAHLWGRDGRLAHHPAPMQGQPMMSDQIGLTGVPDKNATFDLVRHRKPSGVAVAASGPGGSGVASAIPRTTTGLEKWLIKTSTR